ncbi:MAG: hypothetical protein ACK4RV_06780 [Caulobacter sp.]|jgi:hypothetical protein
MRTLVTLAAAAALSLCAAQASAQNAYTVKKDVSADQAGVCLTAAIMMQTVAETMGDGSAKDQELLASTKAVVAGWQNYMNGKGQAFSQAAGQAAARKAGEYQKALEDESKFQATLQAALGEHATCLGYM